ncbi:MAG: hypothetical protein R3C25_14655 [Hyphomonadaceae bacterium]
MASVLIIAGPADFHANALTWALEASGHQCVHWHPAASEAFGVSIASGADDSVSCFGPPNAPFDATWMRRPQIPPPPAGLDPRDLRFLGRELDFFTQGWWASTSGFLANPLAASRQANIKTCQLIAARRAGLSVPATLSSNDLGAVRAFVAAAPGRVIYKTHSPAAWSTEGKQQVVFTTFVDMQALEKVDQHHFNPGIFQHFVPKAYELRICFFGKEIICAKIENADELDWRITKKMALSPHVLPDLIVERLRAFMRDMNLVMGMIDVIVTPEGEHVFLEVNEQGQFLWIELQNPEIPVLHRCAHFLATAGQNGHVRSGAPTRLEDYLASDAYGRYVARYKQQSSANPWITAES